METIYSLRDDSAAIANLQHAASTSGPVGLYITHGLVGSAEWWSQINSGALPVQTESGSVSGFWPGQHGDGPAEFELQRANGTTSRWLCQLEPSAARQQFTVGRAVSVQYVTQTLKAAFNGSHATKVTIAILLG